MTERNKVKPEYRCQRKRGNEQRVHQKLKLARKAIKQKVREAKAKVIAEQVAKATGGQKHYWEAVRAINGGDSRSKQVAIQKFLDSDGTICDTPEANAKAATEHFTKAYNNTRDVPEGAEGAINSITQRPIRIELDDPNGREELEKVLKKAKPNSHVEPCAHRTLRCMP